MQQAVSSIKRLETFRARPLTVGSDTWIGWLWRLTRGPLDPRIAETQLRADLYRVNRALRQRLWALPHLEDARAGVIVHVALVIGCDVLNRNHALWDALRAQDYEAAHDVLLETSWAAMAGDAPEDRRRVLALARQLRTGSVQP